MSLKLIALKLAEKQADELGKQAVEWVQSEEFQENLASKINKNSKPAAKDYIESLVNWEGNSSRTRI